MRLLFDTDALCKLGVMDLIDETISALGYAKSDCYHLPALKYMLIKGRLVEKYGRSLCDSILRKTSDFNELNEQHTELLEELTQIPSIDPGEALMLSTLFTNNDNLLSGDKRAIRALKDISNVSALDYKIITLESALLALCAIIDIKIVRQRALLVAPYDKTIQICSRSLAGFQMALESYQSSISQETAPLLLYQPIPVQTI